MLRHVSVSLPIMMCWQLMWLTKEWALSTYCALRTRVCTSHRNGYRSRVVYELGTIETFGLSGGLQAIVRVKRTRYGERWSAIRGWLWGWAVGWFVSVVGEECARGRAWWAPVDVSQITEMPGLIWNWKYIKPNAGLGLGLATYKSQWFCDSETASKSRIWTNDIITPETRNWRCWSFSWSLGII